MLTLNPQIITECFLQTKNCFTNNTSKSSPGYHCSLMLLLETHQAEYLPYRLKVVYLITTWTHRDEINIFWELDIVFCFSLTSKVSGYRKSHFVRLLISSRVLFSHKKFNQWMLRDRFE